MTESKIENRFDSSTLYDRYHVAIHIRDRIVGGVPRDPALIDAWVRSRTGHDPAQMTAEAGAELTEQQVAGAKEAMAQQLIEGSWNGFKQDDRGLYIEARQIKAGFREMAVMLGVTQKKRGSRQILQHGFEIKGDGGLAKDRIYLGKAKPDGMEEKPIHVMTAQGPRNALKRCDYVEGVTLRFEVWVLITKPQETRHLGEEDIVHMLKLGQENGLGADRSQGAGKFDVVEFQRL